MKVRLQIGVATVFAVLTAVLLGMVMALQYMGNRDLAIQTAQEEMIKARAWSVNSILTTVNDTEQTVGVAAYFAGAYPISAQSVSGLDFLHSLVRGSGHHYSVFFGLQENGAFFQNIVLQEKTDVFGPDATPVPETATRVLRVIEASDGGREETYFWSNEFNMAEPFFKGPAIYDPRERPWYLGAMNSGGLYVTKPYKFASTRQPGVTFARRIVDDANQTIGVIGIDITMSALSRILEDLRIGNEGVVFMLDRQGRLMSYTGTRASNEGATYVTADANEGLKTQSPFVERAMVRWKETGDSFFRFASPDDDRTYLAYVASMPDIFGAEPTLGLVAPAEEFVGAIKRNTTRTIQIGFLALIVAILCTVVAARLLSRSLKVVTAEALRISTFDLSHNLKLKTVFQEISDLEIAMTSMKAGLASFGAYVPKGLVRSIVSSAEKTAIGGTSRDITLLFSDLQGFTAKSEGLEPEDLMHALSRYFEAMETAISENNGNVDKYIGDAVMAMWNAPLDDPNHVRNACRAALGCIKAEKSLNADATASNLTPLFTRFGLHTGRVVVGNVGSLSRMQYTALGSAVNLASRLEGLNKFYGTTILVSEDVANAVAGEFLFREIDIISPVGLTNPTKIFELLAEVDPNANHPNVDTKRLEVEDWKNCYELYLRREWNNALNAFLRHQDTAENKILVQLYIQRCQRFIDNPPDDSWNGVHRFSQK